MTRIAKKQLSGLLKDSRGSTLVEFALLSPAFLLLIFGVIQVGAYAQNYNAVRNLASDASRFALVQYQKESRLTPGQLQTQIMAMGVGDAYNLDPDRLVVMVTNQTSRIAGVKEMELTVNYAPPNFLEFAEVSGLTLTYERPLFLLAGAAPPAP
ncbi:TadE/TadG family type IV pilus assembly protein [Altererythrobacter aquiaggeris]|uniref:TadE/TadG family type IV pilus assembly protein n=1 Tax=Aestuarierythrobacter aquiaggeris TaxID=1898396 RepID=UPI00301AE45E